MTVAASVATPEAAEAMGSSQGSSLKRQSRGGLLCGRGGGGAGPKSQPQPTKSAPYVAISSA
eukprot:COSAG04_NODE_94_length_26569_cov_27.995127_21_plen_62_part_00